MKTKDKFVQKVIESIEEYQMIKEGETVLVGVSGGADSVCLLAVLKHYQRYCSFSLKAIHVEHGLRGTESIEDASFVEKLCRKWQIPCEVVPVDVKKQAKKAGQTLEEAARKLRYDVFASQCQTLGADKIAVAHNQNDQAETVLLNLTRGSGLRGLGGMLPTRVMKEETWKKELFIIRPLLFVSRKEIEHWMQEQGYEYRTDRTNLETDYTRNKLRLEILPKLEQEINRETVRHMAEAAMHLQKAEAFLLQLAEEKQQQCVSFEPKGRAVIQLPLFLQEERLIQEYILRLSIDQLLLGRGLKDYSAFHIEELLRLAQMDCGKRMDFPGGMQAVRQKTELLLIEKTAAIEEAVLGEEHQKNGTVEEKERNLSQNGHHCFKGSRFQVEYLENLENMQTFPEKKYTKWLACDTILEDVCLRTRKTGDYLIINQAGGRKKLKDYMIDLKIPREERDQILLVAQGAHILWIVGYRISEAAKVTAQTKKILKIQMIEEEL